MSQNKLVEISKLLLKKKTNIKIANRLDLFNRPCQHWKSELMLILNL